MGVFGKNSTPPLSPKRNTFDLSHQNNLTMRFGELYPFHVEPVLPGDTAKIDVAFGLRAMPTAFPTQTKIRVDAHYFYVRNRNLWSDWPNFIGKTGNPSPFPQLSVPQLKKQIVTGSLGDYLGLPTCLADENRYEFELLLYSSFPIVAPCTFIMEDNLRFVGFNGTTSNFIPIPFTVPTADDSFTLVEGSRIDVRLSLSTEAASFLSNTGTEQPLQAGLFQYRTSNPSTSSTAILISSIPVSAFTFDSTVVTGSFALPATFGTEVYDPDYLIDGTYFVALYRNVRGSNNGFPADGDTPFVIDEITYTQDSVFPVPSQLVEDLNSEYPISALPFRAYESIYNSFYRDQRNNPYVVNGEQDPNVYLPSTKGGVDTNEYVLRRRNWEQDFLTSAVPSPQQGAAPLVGITSSGVASFASDDGTIHEVQLETEDGDHVTGVRYSTNLPDDVSRSLVNIASSGFSIADFRGVNALQRWLEINMRRGLKYRDQIMSHFGVTPSYAELDMPEFIGGFTKWFDSSQVNQTSATDPAGDPLGSYAGQLTAIGGTEHTITHYCDEHGYIMGIVSIVPVPVYSQLLPKDFIKSDPLDYYFPEFGHLGFQPISYAEVCPFQKLLNDGGGLSSTYGYQRAWYDYLARTDEAHGNFRDTLRDFLLSRVFKSVPSLNADFLTVDPSQLNGIFTVNEIDGVPVMPFLGQIHIKNIMKRPIPKYGIPRLE